MDKARDWSASDRAADAPTGKPRESAEPSVRVTVGASVATTMKPRRPEGHGDSPPVATWPPVGDGEYRVELLGLDVFDPAAMDSDHREGSDVPAWFLDTDYNGLCFHVCQAFFPRTSAWEGLERSLRGEFDDSVWAHLSGTAGAPFDPGEHGQIAVKVVDDRGNELMVIKSLSEA